MLPELVIAVLQCALPIVLACGRAQRRTTLGTNMVQTMNVVTRRMAKEVMAYATADIDAGSRPRQHATADTESATSTTDWKIACVGRGRGLGGWGGRGVAQPVRCE